jgi:hypothetical protein
MKTLIRVFIRVQFMVIILSGMGLMYLPGAMGQDKKLDIDIDVDRDPVWYQQPWAWVVGAAIFILLLVALLRGRKK